MYEIRKAIIVIDMNEYLEGLNKNPGYIDGAAASLEPNQIFTLDEYETLEAAEANISHTAELHTNDDSVSITYEFIAGSENVYFTEVMYQNGIYAIDRNFHSPECYKEVKKNVSFEGKAVTALNTFCKEKAVTLSDDDEVYLWSWFSDDGHRLVRIDTVNHSPEGLLVRVADLATIDNWWEEGWNGEP